MARTYPDLPASRMRTKYSAEEDYQLIAMHRNGAKYITIARALGRNGRSVEERVKRLIHEGKLARREHKHHVAANDLVTEADRQ